MVTLTLSHKQNLLNRGENIVANGDITHNVLFLFLSLCFQKLCSAEAVESVCMWDRVNKLINFTIQCLF